MRRRVGLGNQSTEKYRDDELALLVIQKVQLLLKWLIRALDLVGSQPNQSDFIAVLMRFDIVVMDTRRPVMAAGQCDYEMRVDYPVSMRCV
jgi:hypothetical protein